MIGVVPALFAAAGFAGFQLVNRRALTGVDVYRGTAWLLGVAAALLVTISLAVDGLAAVRTPAVALAFCALAGFVHFFLGWTLLGMSQIRLGVARTGILIGTVPLFGALIAWVALGEALSAIALVGLFVVVGGVALVVSAKGVGAAGQGGGTAAGVAAGLATSFCWSASPVLIRRGLEGVPSPITGAAIGMAACAVVYAIAVLATGARANRATITTRTRQLLLVAGLLVAVGIWMQWTAFDLLPVAPVLAILQLVPVLVVLLSTTLSGEPLGAAAPRVWLGTVVTVAGSLTLILGT